MGLQTHDLVLTTANGSRWREYTVNASATLLKVKDEKLNAYTYELYSVKLHGIKIPYSGIDIEWLNERGYTEFVENLVIDTLKKHIKYFDLDSISELTSMYTDIIEDG